MQRIAAERDIDTSIRDVMAGIEAGDDPRLAMARINRQIVDFQKAGQDVPPRLLRLSKQLASECIAQSQGR